MELLCCCFGGGAGAGSSPQRDPVMLDTTYMGSECVIVKAGRRICGTGGCIGTAPLNQDKSYWEAKLQAQGVWGLGVAVRQAKLDDTPLGTDNQAWVLRHTGLLFHKGERQGKAEGAQFEEGDIISCSYDHCDLKFFLNGKSLDTPLSGIRGQVYPVFYVDDGAILDVTFSDFTFPPPLGYEQIMHEQRLI